MSNYSILIPIHNEARSIPELLFSLADYFNEGHQIIIIDDGSNDGSTELLQLSKIIDLRIIDKNKGKGNAIKEGLKIVRNDKVIIFDGDLELNPIEISKLMILDKYKGIYFSMGYRFIALNPIKSYLSWGNFMFTTFHNIIFNSYHKDILCCAKSFYIDNINTSEIRSNGFDIDLELTSLLTINNKSRKIPQIHLKYKRRTINEGKKLKISDGWTILKRCLTMIKYI